MILEIYALYATWLALRKPLKSELLHFTTFWFLYNIITNVKRVALWWIPLIDYIEWIVLSGCLFPPITESLRNEIVCILKKLKKEYTKIRSKRELPIIPYFVQAYNTLLRSPLFGLANPLP
jgi:hypothetical protein